MDYGLWLSLGNTWILHFVDILVIIIYNNPESISQNVNLTVTFSYQ